MVPSSLHLLGRTSSLVAAALYSISFSGPGHAQAPITNSGTLTCTVADVPNKPTVAVKLSCNFKSHSGVTSDYEGTAGTKSGAFPTAKHVFVWTVVATDTRKGPLLNGTFAARAGREGHAVLIGGADGSTRLEPAGRKEQVTGPAEITTLTLKLAATKT